MQRSLLSFGVLIPIAACSKPAPQQQQAAAAAGVPWALYRMADLRWESRDALERGIATPGFKAVAADLANFATGGVTVLVGGKTN
jgi:hypothetical protein